MRISGLIGAMCVSFMVATASAQVQSPGDVVSSLYSSAYGLGPNSGKTGLDEGVAAKFFDDGLLSLYRRALKRGIDADFFVQGQDFSITKPIEIENVSTVGKRAKVSATLTQSFESKPLYVRHFIFVLVNTSSGWRFDDAFCGGQSLTDSWKS
jgi:hypothetical protein